MDRKAFDSHTGLQDAARKAMVADVEDTVADALEAGASKLAWLKGELLDVHAGLWAALVLTLILAVAVGM